MNSYAVCSSLALAQKVAFACGSMVLYVFYLFFFTRPGEKE
jgi:hypothetical protein